MIARDQVSEESSHSTCSTQVDRDGYAIIPNVLSSEEIHKLASDLESSDLRRSRAGVRHMLGNPAIMQVANDPRLLGMAQSVLGEDAVPFKATLFDKSPDANWLITWHQDTALPLVERNETEGWGPWSMKEGVNYAHAPAKALNRVLAIRLHLDDSTEENGPLRVLPGTHSFGVLTDEQVERNVAERSPVHCTVGEGGIIIMKPLIIHASSKSRSTLSRRVLHMEYSTSLMIDDRLKLAMS